MLPGGAEVDAGVAAAEAAGDAAATDAAETAASTAADNATSSAARAATKAEEAAGRARLPYRPPKAPLPYRPPSDAPVPRFDYDQDLPPPGFDDPRMPSFSESEGDARRTFASSLGSEEGDYYDTWTPFRLRGRGSDDDDIDQYMEGGSYWLKGGDNPTNDQHKHDFNDSDLSNLFGPPDGQHTNWWSWISAGLGLVGAAAAAMLPGGAELDAGVAAAEAGDEVATGAAETAAQDAAEDATADAAQVEKKALDATKRLKIDFDSNKADIQEGNPEDAAEGFEPEPEPETIGVEHSSAEGKSLANQLHDMLPDSVKTRMSRFYTKLQDVGDETDDPVAKQLAPNAEKPELEDIDIRGYKPDEDADVDVGVMSKTARNKFRAWAKAKGKKNAEKLQDKLAQQFKKEYGFHPAELKRLPKESRTSYAMRLLGAKSTRSGFQKAFLGLDVAAQQKTQELGEKYGSAVALHNATKSLTDKETGVLAEMKKQDEREDAAQAQRDAAAARQEQILEQMARGSADTQVAANWQRYRDRRGPYG